MSKYALSLTRILKDTPGWYQGDFHCHTNYSDGVLTPQELLELARSEGLDFFAITDHNRLDAYPGFGEPDDLCVIPGIEVTFDRGHFNIFGMDREHDWLNQVCSGPFVWAWEQAGLELNQLMEQSAAAGLLNSINHPLLAPWAWLDGATDIANLHCLEIWNDPSWPDNQAANPQAVALWTEWLEAGYRMTAIGGSDFHQPVNAPGVVKAPERLGLPRTYVWAENLSGAAILEGVRHRRVYMTMGLEVSFVAQAGQQTYAIGADAGQVSGPVTLAATLGAGEQAGVARLLRNGAVLHEETLTHKPLVFQQADLLEPGLPVWYRLDVYDTDGRLLAITNPIFFGPQTTPKRRRFGDFVTLPPTHKA